MICGAAIWALGPVSEVIGGMSDLVAPGGALAISLPAAYLGDGDDPGGGADPEAHRPCLKRLPELDLGNPPGAALPPLSDHEPGAGIPGKRLLHGAVGHDGSG